MATKKMTKRDHFNALLALSEVQANPALVEFCKHELEQLEKKNSGTKKPTEKQMQNISIKGVIYEGMEPNRLYTVTEILKEILSDEKYADLTNQRVSALLRQMIDEGDVVKTVEKRQSLFSKA